MWRWTASPDAAFQHWATAATNIQDAVDLATDGDTVLVTNGVYAVGGKGGHCSWTSGATRLAQAQAGSR